MPWPLTSSVNAIVISCILEHQSDGFSLPQINGALDRAFDAAESTRAGLGNALVAEIEKWVGFINSYDTQLNASAANAGLIQADVLRWETGGGQLQGLRDERARYVWRIASKLGLQVRGGAGGPSGYGLVRS